MLLLRDHGTVCLRDVLSPAIGYAEAGFPAVDRIGGAIRAMDGCSATTGPPRPRCGWPTVPAPSGRLRNPALAATWRRLLKEAEAASPDRDGQIEAALAAFYEGFVAEAIAGYLATAEVMDVSGRRHKGLLDGDDLGGWRAAVEAPVSAERRGWTVCKAGPWGQGPVLLQQLALLDGFDLESMGLDSSPYVRTVAECAKLAIADREAWYGDPAAFDVPLDELLSPAYNAAAGPSSGTRRRWSCAREAGRAHAPPARGRPRPGGRRGRRRAREVRGAHLRRHLPRRRGRPPGQHGRGHAQRRLAPELAGRPRPRLLPGHPPPDDWLEEGLASSLTPAPVRGPPSARRSPCATASPAGLRDPGRGRPGPVGLQFFLAHARFGLDLQEAVDAPSFQSDHFPSSFWPRRAFPGKLVVEAGHDPAAIAGLRERGHLVTVADPWSLGRTCAAGRDLATGFLIAGANPRGRQAYAVGR